MNERNHSRAGSQSDVGSPAGFSTIDPTFEASRPVKRSFSIAGHRTSISLEAAFWEAFRELCDADGVAMAARLAEIDRAREDQSGLSGAVRVWILARYRDRAGA